LIAVHIQTIKLLAEYGPFGVLFSGVKAKSDISFKFYIVSCFVWLENIFKRKLQICVLDSGEVKHKQMVKEYWYIPVHSSSFCIEHVIRRRLFAPFQYNCGFWTWMQFSA